MNKIMKYLIILIMSLGLAIPAFTQTTQSEQSTQTENEGQKKKRNDWLDKLESDDSKKGKKDSWLDRLDKADKAIEKRLKDVEIEEKSDADKNSDGSSNKSRGTDTDTSSKTPEEKSKSSGKSDKQDVPQSTPIDPSSELPVDMDKPLGDEDFQSKDFIYNPNGRRDPFVDLLRGKTAGSIKREAKEGIAGLLIEELELEGIMKVRGAFVALFKGPDGKPYDVYVGDNVYDGEVIKIDNNTVYFKGSLATALGGTKEKIITKSLVPEEEAEQK